jgi:PKHD-type hydroxylase|tara:strand:- start:317 stop:910 length:594 start_codon:yes stop_codon:yes gene_type:complete
MTDKKIATSWSFKLDTVQSWAYWNNFLSKKECEEIISYCKKFNKSKAAVDNDSKVVRKIRESDVVFLYPDKNLNNLYRKITDAILTLNNKYFNFNLWGMAEGLQFTHYKAPNGKYVKHIDKMLNGQIRKLSMSIQLSDPKKYKGGDLVLYNSDKPTLISRDQGKLIVFPSYTLHEVKKIVEGERYSLVAWFTGEPFK